MCVDPEDEFDEEEEDWGLGDDETDDDDYDEYDEEPDDGERFEDGAWWEDEEDG